MKPVARRAWRSDYDNKTTYEVLVDGSETGLWAFQTNQRILDATTSDSLPYSEGDHSGFPCLYRVVTDEVGMFRLHGIGSGNLSPSAMRSLARKIFPNITKSSWRTNKNTVRLMEEEDKMLYQLTYGGAHVT